MSLEVAGGQNFFSLAPKCTISILLFFVFLWMDISFTYSQVTKEVLVNICPQEIFKWPDSPVSHLSQSQSERKIYNPLNWCRS